MMPHKLHFFFPENDLALARDIARYTAPPAAVKLRNAGATVPMWFGDKGDAAIVRGVNAQWLDNIRSRFDIVTDIFHGDTARFNPAPWGWSKASRQVFADIGYDREALPSDEALERLRNLSHRRTAAVAAKLLADRLPFEVAPPARELTSQAQISDFIKGHPQGSILKLPWSSSGRGLMAADPSIKDSGLKICYGMLSRQGAVMAEPRYNKTLDFALLYTMESGKCTFTGYSLFNNVMLGSYAGNTLAPQNLIEEEICRHVGAEELAAVRDALPAILEEIAPEYDGPLGIDMMAVRSARYRIVPVVEINFRMTMGHVCLRLYSKHIADGRTGSFSIRQTSAAQPSGFFDARCADGKVLHGSFDLAAPGCDFSFVVAID